MNNFNVQYQIPQRVIDESWAFLYERGLEGCEGTALWIGQISDEADGQINITRLFVPEQICTKSRYGVAVDLTERAHYTLTDNLEIREQFYIRIHSHPGEAYHSGRDDNNQVITHQGAISIVVPDFATVPADLKECAIYKLQHGKGWLKLNQNEVDKIFKVTNE